MLQLAVEPSVGRPEAERPEAEPSNVESLGAFALRRLVMVADDSLIAEAVRAALRMSGEFELVGFADTWRTSAPAILAAGPKVVLLDDMERSERAKQLLTELRAVDEEIPLIVLSLELDAAWLGQLFGAGATAVISKAIHPIALATLVRETLNGRVFRAPPEDNAGSPEPSAPQDLPLSARELEILELVASGCTNADVARQLWITEQTVKFHLRNTYRKLGVANRTQASHVLHISSVVSGRPEFSGDLRMQLQAAS
jgi:DNA-binding NarL/FixJ family response regulator